MPIRSLPLILCAALAVLHAVLFFLAFHPVAAWPLAFVCAAPLAVAVRDARPLAAYATGFAGYFLHGMLSVWWLNLLGAPPWLGTSLGFAFYGLLFAWWARGERPHCRARNREFESRPRELQ